MRHRLSYAFAIEIHYDVAQGAGRLADISGSQMFRSAPYGEPEFTKRKALFDTCFREKST